MDRFEIRYLPRIYLEMNSIRIHYVQVLKAGRLTTNNSASDYFSKKNSSTSSDRFQCFHSFLFVSYPKISYPMNTEKPYWETLSSPNPIISTEQSND